MFDECAGNFSHKRLRALLWLLAVIVFFAIVRQVSVRRLERAASAVDAGSVAGSGAAGRGESADASAGTP